MFHLAIGSLFDYFGGLFSSALMCSVWQLPVFLELQPYELDKQPSFWRRPSYGVALVGGCCERSLSDSIADW